MLRKLSIKNYKSIYDDAIELGRINIFIGENGCGKTNILEALGMASASKAMELHVEGLSNRGVRIAKPSLTFSSFLGIRQKHEIRIDLEFQENNEKFELPSVIYSKDENDIYSQWKDDSLIYLIDEVELHLHGELHREFGKERIQEPWIVKEFNGLTKYLIFNLNTKALRGLRSESKRLPLGINGESLDVLLSQFKEEEWETLKKYNYMISWLKETVIDENDSLKFKGHKLGNSSSKLYFEDKFMQKKNMNNLFSAENANDGVLHVMFYLVLFLSSKTPSLFAIDNIENSVNPMICRTLTKELVALAKAGNKQALITTHNPAVLDGLNLLDDEQRLFVVSRNDNGMTKTKRIKYKPKTTRKLKLSEMWMRGLIGGLPKNF